SWVLAFLWPLFYPQEDCRPIVWFFLAATVGLLVHRVVGAWRRSRGREVHSQYPGDSLLGNTEREFMLLMIATVVALAFNKPLGVYMLVATICFWVSQAWQRAGEKAQIRVMRDLKIERENLMRQMQDDV